MLELRNSVRCRARLVYRSRLGCSVPRDDQASNAPPSSCQHGQRLREYPVGQSPQPKVAQNEKNDDDRPDKPNQTVHVSLHPISVRHTNDAKVLSQQN